MNSPQQTRVNAELERPHLVMAVGNLVLGDSRVEKAAISAHRLGYKVTVVGVRRRTVQQVSFIDGEIPIIRIPVGRRNHEHIVESLRLRTERAAQRKSRINRMSGNIRRLAYLANRVLDRGHDTIVRLQQKLRLPSRRLWPHIADYEEAFFEAFRALAPDIIHVHDRHPLPGAAAYGRWNRRASKTRPVRWIYDAHEFVPTQHMPPPIEHHQGWVAAEREAIGQADAVVTVSDQIAHMLQRRHTLKTVPTVVRNQPSLTHARRNALRTDVRTTAGVPDGVPLAVYVGGIAPMRGLATLLDAQKLLPDLHVAIVGKDDPEQRASLRLRATHNDAADRLHLLDYVPAAHVSRFISTADVGVSPLLDSAAHRTASPTKVSEYLHARIPVVVSDLAAQAERVRSIGFGEAFTSGDPVTLADAIRRVLADQERYRARITDAVVLANSWEADEPALQQLWSRLSPDDRRPLAPELDQPTVAVLTNDGLMPAPWRATAMPVLERAGTTSRLPQLHHVHGDLTDPTFMLTSDGLRFLEFWRTKIAAIKGVLYDTSPTLVQGWPPALTSGILTMSGKPAIRMLTGDSLVNVDRIRELFPNHWLHEITDEEYETHHANFAAALSLVAMHDRTIVTDDLTTALSFGSRAEFVPPSIEVIAAARRSSSGALRIGWLADVQRSQEDALAVSTLEDALKFTDKVKQISTQATAPQLHEFDLIVDSLSSDSPSETSLRAMGAGCAIVTGNLPLESRQGASNSAALFLQRMPMLRSSPSGIASSIDSYCVDSDAIERLNSATQVFASRNLSQSANENRWREIFGLPHEVDGR